MKQFKKIALSLFCCLLLLIFWDRAVFGHACHDPWRPTPGSPGSPPTGPTPPLPPNQPPTQPGLPPQPGMSATAFAEPLPTVPLASQSFSNAVLPDQILLIPENRKIKIVGKSGEMRVYVENRSPRDLFDVSLLTYSGAFNSEVLPKSIARLVSGERAYFTVKLELKNEYKYGKYSIDFAISSRGKKIVSASLDEVSAAPKLLEPEKNIVKIVNTVKFNVALSNVLSQPLRNVKLSIADSGKFVIKITPRVLVKLGTKQKTKFVVELTSKRNLSDGSYPLQLKLKDEKNNLIPGGEAELKVNVYHYAIQLVPDNKKITVAKSGRFTVTLKNIYSHDLEDIKLDLKSDKVNFSLKPKSIKKMTGV